LLDQLNKNVTRSQTREVALARGATSLGRDVPTISGNVPFVGAGLRACPDMGQLCRLYR